MYPTVKWTELLCPACQADCVANPWTWGRRWKRNKAGDFSECPDCQDRFHTVAKRYGKFATTGRHGLPDRKYREMVATHEAAHAVVGLEFGYPLLEASVADDPNAAVGGQVLWDFRNGDQVNNDEYTAKAMAGVLAEHRWLVDNGHVVTDTEWIELSHSATGDMNNVLDLIGHIPEGGIELARDMVHDRFLWRRVGRLAEALDKHGHLDPRQVRTAMKAKPPTPTPAPVPEQAATVTAAVSGGNAMGIDEIRQAVAASNEKADFARGALREARQQFEEIVSQLAAIGVDTSSQEGPKQALATYSQLRDQLDGFQEQVGAAMASLEQYAYQF
ncbi:hypothetical protein IU422_25445 [Nocardia farcinica]|nr:hypothetical protein [Nocardia farcinica]